MLLDVERLYTYQIKKKKKQYAYNVICLRLW